jgi:hypothetical protein
MLICSSKLTRARKRIFPNLQTNWACALRKVHSLVRGGRGGTAIAIRTSALDDGKWSVSSPKGFGLWGTILLYPVNRRLWNHMPALWRREWPYASGNETYLLGRPGSLVALQTEQCHPKYGRIFLRKGFIPRSLLKIPVQVVVLPDVGVKTFQKIVLYIRGT